MLHVTVSFIYDQATLYLYTLNRARTTHLWRICIVSHDSFVFLFLVLGPAHQSPAIASKASFSHPAGIDVLMIQPGKNEIAFVCDKGNSCIRFIKDVHSFQGDKFVGMLKVQSTPANWKPEDLAVIRHISSYRREHC